MVTTVTGLTAERMQEMEDATIIDGNVVGNDLILTTKGGTDINTGNVRGPTGAAGTNGTNGATGATGAAGVTSIPVYADASARDTAIPSPTPGQSCFLLSNGQYLVYQGTAIVGSGHAGWYPPWNTSWGEIDGAYQELTSNSTPINGPGNLTGLNFTIQVPNFRRVEFEVYGQISLDGGSAAEARLHICKDGVSQQFGTAYVPTANRGYSLGVKHEYLSDGASHAWNVQIERATGSAHAYMICTSTLKTYFHALDIGLG